MLEGKGKMKIKWFLGKKKRLGKKKKGPLQRDFCAVVGVWGTPCSIQRGLARRLCILLVCTDPLSSALAPKLQEVYEPYASAPASAAGATLRGARGWPRNWIALLIMLANFSRA